MLAKRIRQLAVEASLELSGELGIRCLVGGKPSVPVALQHSPSLAGVPRVVDCLRNLERRIWPAQRFTGKRHFLLTQRLSMREIGPRSIGRALADDRAAADESRPVGARVRPADCLVDGVDIVPVDARNDLPPVGLEAPRRVVGEPLPDLSVDGDAVIVVETYELGQALRTR